jgi:hypothetical protein
MFFRKKQQLPDEERTDRKPLRVQSKRAFSYYSSRRSELDQRQRLRPEATARLDISNGIKRPLLKQIPLIIFGIIVVGCFAYNLVLSASPRVIVNQDGTQNALTKSQEEYEDAVMEAFGKSIFNRFKPTIQTEQVTEQIANSNPELTEVNITVPLVGITPVVYVETGKPVLTIETFEDGRYALDQTGIALGRVRETDYRGLPNVIDESDVGIESGKRALPEQFVTFISRLTYQLRAKDIEIESLTLPSGTQELRLQEANKSYYVRFSMRENPLRQAGAYIALTKHLKRAQKLPKEYVDIRVGERVYYK